MLVHLGPLKLQHSSPFDLDLDLEFSFFFFFPLSESAAVGLGANVIATCSADKTIRLWNLAALDGPGAEPSASTVSSTVSAAASTSTSSSAAGKWTNIYSKYLLRVLYVDSPTAEQEGGCAAHRGAAGRVSVAARVRRDCKTDFLP